MNRAHESIVVIREWLKSDLKMTMGTRHDTFTLSEYLSSWHIRSSTHPPIDPHLWKYWLLTVNYLCLTNQRFQKPLFFQVWVNICATKSLVLHGIFWYTYDGNQLSLSLWTPILTFWPDPLPRSITWSQHHIKEMSPVFFWFVL